MCPVAGQYPAPFYEPFTTLAWLAGITGGIRPGTTVLVVPYRHPLLIARMAANLNDLSGGRLVLGVGVGRAVRLGEAWHPLRFTMPWLREAVDRMSALADEQRRPVPGLAPRIALRLAQSPVTGPGRLAGEGTIDQVLDDLAQLRLLGAGAVVLDPFNAIRTRRTARRWHGRR